MRSIIYTGRFRKDLKLLKKQGADLELLREILLLLQMGKPLDPKYEDHPLHGRLEGKRDCHIAPDWVLIYAMDQDSLTLYRTGTHAELFR
jgi:mRNA interferase YafQ